jgi:hypothetical protein
MDAMKRVRFLALVFLFTAAACDHLTGLGGPPTPLASIQVMVTGDLTPLRPPGDTGTPHLRVGLMWGAQWLPEPFCFLPPAQPEDAPVITAGCRDPFGFAPNRLAASTPVTVGTPVTLELLDLPGADVMVGDVTSRVAYGSLVVFDDRDGSGTLEPRTPLHPHDEHDGDGNPPPGVPTDIIYGASFVSMTQTDTRIAFREGGFDTTSAFYPRSGCTAPDAGFSILSAGGFSASDAFAALLLGQLPQENPASCAQATLDTGVVTIALAPPPTVREVDCNLVTSDGITPYHEAGADPPPLYDMRPWTCTTLPQLPGETRGAGIVQLVLAGPPDDPCLGTTHYTLRGCRDDAACDMPDWDHTASPPTWWPCVRAVTPLP